MVYKSSTGGGGGGVTSLNAETGDVVLQSTGGTIVITKPDGTHINLEAGGSAGVSSLSGDGTYITNSLSTGAVTLTTTFGNSAQKTASTTATAGDVVLRDANANVFNNNSLQNATKTTSAGGTTVLTAASSRYQALTGSSSQTYQLPDATTLSLGPWFTFNNNSSGSLIITNAGTSTLYTLPAGGIIQCGPTDISTANGAWDFHGYFPSTVTWGSGTTGLRFNTALTTSPSIIPGIASATNPVFIPQAGTSNTGYSGDSTHLYGVVGGSTAWTATTTTFNIPSGANYQINGSQLAAANLSDGTTGSGSIVLATSPTLVTPVLGTPASGNLANCTLPSNAQKRSISVTFDGGGTALTSGKTVYLATVPYAGTITAWDVVADQSGSAVIDVWKANAAVPTVANTITASAKPTISSAQSAFAGAITGWTTAVSAGDVFAFHLDSATTVTSVTLTILITAT